MKRLLKKLAAQLPERAQQELKRKHFRRTIRDGTFRTDEPEYSALPDLLSPGDWVLDIGANVGHYTLRFSTLVGEHGRVIAMEPVPETFELLAANAALAPHRNITLINAAAAQRSQLSGMSIPRFDDTHLANFYQAQLSSTEANLHVLCFAVDALDVPERVRLVKIDTEGFELAVLRGMSVLLARDHPTLIVEDNDPLVLDHLVGLGYTAADKLPGSSNSIFHYTAGND